jgi:hypothetical protein
MRVTGLLPAPARAGRALLGRWRVDAAESAEAEALQRAWSPGAEGHPLPPGDYSVLLIDGAFSMCDAPFMLRNYVPFVRAAAGDVLLTGLGLGCLVRGLLARPAVRSVTVLELLPEVIGLIGPAHRDPRLTVLPADALRWTPPPGRVFDAAMLDVDDDRSLVERLLAHHAPHVHALWPDPAEMDDEPPGPDLRHLVARACAAAEASVTPGGTAAVSHR